MRPNHFTGLERVLALASAVLIVRVTASVVSNYHDYFPPSFSSDFLRGRERYFFGAYQWAFCTHIISGPIVLIVGLILIGAPFRVRFPRWHRWLGRIQVACVLLLVAPSGFAMARYAQAGPIAAAGLGTLAIATAVCACWATWSAKRRRFADHRRWMWRCYLLLCSAVVLRVIGGLATVTGVTASWVDPLANWLNWLLPLAAFELHERMRRRSGSVGLKRAQARPLPGRREPSVP